MTFHEWLESNDACDEAMKWLGDRTIQQTWDECERGEWLAWWLGKAGLDDSTLRLIACDMVRYTPLSDGRTVWDLLTDERSRNAVEVTERYAVGEATDKELQAAWELAWSVARDAPSAAAWEAPRSAAWAAAGDAARSAAWGTAWAAARDAAGKAQADLLRKRVSWQMVEELMGKQLAEGTV